MNMLIFIILSLLFLISPYFKGLYYNSSFYPIVLIVSSLFLLFTIRVWLKKEWHRVSSSLPVLLIPVCFGISFFVAENPKGAADTFIQWVTYAALFILLYTVNQEKRIKVSMPFIFHLAGSSLAIFTILIYYDVVFYRSTVVAGRFAGVFQYPNTFGMVMAVFILFGLILLSKEKLTNPELIFYSFSQVALLVCLIQSFSRGMFVIFPIVWFIGLILLTKKQQLEYFLYTLLLFTLGITVYRFIERGEKLHHEFPGVFALIFGSLLFIILTYFIKKNISKVDSLKDGKRIVIPGIVFITAIAGILDVKYEGLMFKLLPEQLQERLLSVSFESATLQERFIFVKDAFKLSTSSPFIGFGGEAWTSMYKTIQQLPYISNKIHNGYLEWIVDTGWVGFLLILAVFIYLFLGIWKSEGDSILKTAVFVTLLTIFLHSFMDFNFSYSWVWLMIFWLFAMGMKQNVKTQSTRLTATVTSLFTIIVIVSAIFSIRFILAEQAYEKSQTMESKTLKEMSLKKAVSLDPLHTTYHIKLAEHYVKIEDEQAWKKSLERAINLESHNSTIYQKAGYLAEKMDRDELGLFYYYKGLEVDRYNKELYESIIRLNVDTLKDLEKQEDSKLFLDDAVKVYRDNLKWYQYFIEYAPKDADRFNSREFLVTDQTKYYAAVAYYLKGDYNQVIEISKQMESTSTEWKNITALAILSFEQLKKGEMADQLLMETEKMIPNMSDSLQYFRSKFNK